MILITIEHEMVNVGLVAGTWGLIQDPENGELKKLFVQGFKLSFTEFQKIVEGGFQGGPVKEMYSEA